MGKSFVEQSSAPGMALYSTCQTSIHNIEICHGCFAILMLYQYMLSSFMSYAKVLDRPDDPGTDRSSLCFRVCSSVLHVHPKGGRPGDARVVTSCMSVVQRKKNIWTHKGPKKIKKINNSIAMSSHYPNKRERDPQREYFISTIHLPHTCTILINLYDMSSAWIHCLILQYM